MKVEAHDEFVLIDLSRGFQAMVDRVDADLQLLNWSLLAPNAGNLYAYRLPTVEGKRVFVALHRVVMSRILNRELNRRELVDHEDCNGLNCRRGNLRLASRAQNRGNSRLSSANTSGYKGVSQIKSSGKWCAQITINGKTTNLGNYLTPEDAYAVYCEAAIKHFGEFARLK